MAEMCTTYTVYIYTLYMYTCPPEVDGQVLSG